VEEKYGLILPVWMITPCTKRQIYEVLAGHSYEVNDTHSIRQFMSILEQAKNDSTWWIVVFSAISLNDRPGACSSLCLLIDDSSGSIHEMDE
jgi:hypothetical protein